MEILERVYSIIQKHHMTEPGEKLVVGVSGGPDSIALLDMLYRLREQLQISLHVAHLNHMFRGEEALEDARFVQRVAGAYALPVTVKNFDVPAYKKSTGLSSQVAARKIRMAFFREVAGQEAAGKIALAHHATDQAETIMMHFLRGTGLTGLKGILPVRDIFIRPLLGLTREEIEAYCRERNLAYRVDSSNLKTDYLRNKIRMHLLPVLEKEYNRALVSALGRLGEICREEDQYLADRAGEVYESLKTGSRSGEVGLKLAEFGRQPQVLRRRILRRAWYEVNEDYRDLNYEHVERALWFLAHSPAGSKLELPKKVLVKKNDESFTLVRNKYKSKRVQSYCYRLKIPGCTFIPEINKTLRCEVLARQDFTPDFSRLPLQEAAVDLDSVDEPLYVRERRPGDIFQPLGLAGKIKLKDFFINQKVPREERYRIPIVVGGCQIVWVGGMRIAEKVKINTNTKKILYLQLL